MCEKLFPVLVLCLICAFSAAGQSVIETESTALASPAEVTASLAVESAQAAKVPVRIELVDTEGVVVSSFSNPSLPLARGRQVVDLKLAISDELKDDDTDLAWYRIRYRIGNARGILSLSQLIKDLFELRIISPRQIPTGITYRTRVRALNPFTGEPASGVAVDALLELEVVDRDDELVLTGYSMTDADGFANIDIAVPADIAFAGDGEITVTGRRAGIVREASDELDTETEDTQFLLMSDKPIYQPGQTLNVRGILLKGTEGMTVMPGIEVDIRIVDEDDTLLYREKVVTSEFGVASLSWGIPENVRLGNYSIEAGIPGAREIGMHRVRVTRYDLPNFVVSAETDKPYYLPADRIAAIEVKADYLFGKPVPGGKVRVVEENSREWNWKEQKYDIDEGEVVEGKADSEGKFIARFDLTESHSDLRGDNWEKFRDLRFAAYYTDPTTNRTEQRRFDVRLSEEPIHVYVIRDWDVSPELDLEMYLSTFYADGTPAACEVELRARSENSTGSYRRVASVRTNSYGAGKLSMPRPNIGGPTDDLEFMAIARDSAGRHGKIDEVRKHFDDDPAIRIYTDKAIYKPGEPVRVDIVSTQKDAAVHVDVVRGWSVVDSHFAVLKNGRATLEIPYNEQFRGELKIGAYIENGDEDAIAHARGAIYPSRSGLEVAATFDKAVYKPNEEAAVSIGVLDSLGRSIQSALGIVVVDQAVEERSRTDSEFAGMFRNWGRWLGYGANFGSINIKDLNELDLSKPISDELQLVAEVILFSPGYYPNIFRSDGYDEEAKYVFGLAIKRQFEPVSTALTNAFEKQNSLHPTNGDQLRDILGRAGIDFDSMSDPWGIPYAAQFSVDKKLNVVTIRSAGPDKTHGTSDDFEASRHTFEYFSPTGKAINAAIKNYQKRTGEFIRDRKTLLAELGMPELNDRFGRPYQVIFEGDGRWLVTRIRSLGPDGVASQYSWRGDDFDVWSSRIDFFAELEQRIGMAQSAVATAPGSEKEFRDSLRTAGIDLDEIRDGNGEPLYVKELKTSRYWDRITFETVQNHGETEQIFRRVLTPVTQEIIKFTIRGPGRDRRPGTYDDLTLMEVVHVLSEQSREDVKPVAVTVPAAHVNGSSIITGTVTDQAGAVVPGAVVTATHDGSQAVRSTATDDSGRFAITGLVPGTYSLAVEAVGFTKAVFLGIRVGVGTTNEVRIAMEIGTVDVTVSVSGEVDQVVNSSSASVSSTITPDTILDLPLTARNVLQLTALQPGVAASKEPNSTPRLREYFPETLYWQPEIITGADGRAQVSFRMADNITTWKMYTIASSRDGKIGIAETKATAFQAFFADLDPPKFLTRGDEIFLPVQVRNYTDSEQGVDVEMADADWFSFLAAQKTRLNVASGATENAVFGFRAERPVDEGKQRVTAIADTESDAIEKPVTVRPDGREMVATESRYFTGSTTFKVDFPANALAETSAAELKIYPNLMAHVVESVEGLLERPYGCGEQTISSTYPNVMILKFAGANGRVPAPIESKARKYIRSGYERLVGYQVADGGFSYWGGRDSADLALTAYALRFLADAAEFTNVDPAVVAKAEKWLISQQRSDGSWAPRYRWETSTDERRAAQTTAYIARTLAMLKADRKDGMVGGPELNASLDRALTLLRARSNAFGDSYTLSLFGLTLADAGDAAGATLVAERIAALAKVEGTGVYWNLESNTAFNGWGSAGRIETTALAAHLLMKLDRETGAGGLVSKAMLFLLGNKDRYGVWYSTQTTINVLDAFLAAMDGVNDEETQSIQVLLNGSPLRTIEITPDKLDQIIVSLSEKITGGSNHIELRATGDGPLMASVTSTHYIGWNDIDPTGRTESDSRALQLNYECDKTAAAIMDEVTCSVAAKRIGYRGYGMLLAEIGLPPGADVSRESLEAAAEKDWSFARYEVLPDRIIAYLWARPDGTNFSFKFRPRYGINAKTPASVVYDYYNPEAGALVAPLHFSVK